MRNNYFLIFNNLNSKFDLGLSIVKRPNIPSSSKKKITKEIPGRDGFVYEVIGGYEDIIIPVQFNFLEKDNLKERFRQIKSWIDELEDNKLIFSDDPEWFYRVVDVKLNGDFETILRQKGLFRIDFTCRAYQYTLDGNNFIQLRSPSNLYNYYLSAKPLLRIEGHGNVSITINDNTFEVSVTDCVYIDSELEIAYINKKDPFNIKKGSFPILKKGVNKISYSDNITNLEIMPRWRCL